MAGKRRGRPPGSKTKSTQRAGTGKPRRGPLYLKIYKDILDDIRVGRYAQGQMLASEHELCARYDTSRQTVRNALKMLEEAGMVTTRPGRGWMILSDSADPASSRRVVFAACNSNTAVAAMISAALQQRLVDAGVVFENAPVPYIDSAEAEGRFLDWFQSRRPRGLVLFADGLLSPAMEKLVGRKHLAAVVVGFQDHTRCATVCTDNFSASRLLVNHLVSLGHRNILFASSRGFIPRVRSFEMRMHGYESAMTQHELQPRVLLGDYNAWGLPGEEKLLTDTLQQAREQGQPITAIVACSNATAVGMIEVLLRNSVRVPDEVSVVSYGGAHERSLMMPFGLSRMTHAEERWDAVAAIAAGRMIDALGDSEPVKPSLTLVPSRLVAGDTSRAV